MKECETLRAEAEKLDEAVVGRAAAVVRSSYVLVGEYGNWESLLS
jgi:hypothetical protein